MPVKIERETRGKIPRNEWAFTFWKKTLKLSCVWYWATLFLLHISTENNNNGVNMQTGKREWESERKKGKTYGIKCHQITKCVVSSSANERVNEWVTDVNELSWICLHIFILKLSLHLFVWARSFRKKILIVTSLSLEWNVIWIAILRTKRCEIEWNSSSNIF